MSRCFKPVSCSNMHTPSGLESPHFCPVQVPFLILSHTFYSRVGQMFRILLPALVTAFIFLGGFTSPLTAATTQTPGEEFLLLYSNDVRGEIDPCG
jgi:hypothetical protein